MARFYPEQSDDLKGKLFIKEDFPNCVYVEYQPSSERLRQIGINLDNVKVTKKTLLCINGQDNLLVIYPINTNFMQPKYDQIKSITLEGFDYETPETIEEVEYILENLPSGFVKDYEYGLGLQKEYRFIIEAIEEMKGIKDLVISKGKTIMDARLLHENEEKDYYYLKYKDYDSIRKGINKISSRLQSEGRVDKSIFAYNALLNTLNPTQYPKRHHPYKKDSLLEFISSNDMQQADLSVSDQEEIVNLISQNKKDIAKNKPTALIKLHNEIELITLENLIERFAEMLSNNLGENHWQKFFSKNSFILSLAFSYPVIKLGEQTCVGGRTFSGAGDKFADFLVKNNFTDNSALIEIKTPNTQLLNKSAYRGSVYSPSPDFSGSINQLLDQKYKFQQEITQLKANARNNDLESYSVCCLLIIGKTPEEPDRKKSFELFRGNSKDIAIITFDELLEKLKRLYSFLSSSD
ncbi:MULTISPECIES: Shedu immune nuclease family protein [Methylobacter]